MSDQTSPTQTEDLRKEARQTVVGYMHPAYAESLAEFGTPRPLSKCGGWILERPIAGFPYRDAMGCYPLFACQDWGQLCSDLEEIGDDLVSLSMVADPFGAYDVDYLRRCFPDVSYPFKEHHVVDLSRSPETFVSRHHRRHARKALQVVQVERCQEPRQFLEDWLALYAALIERHNIEGIQAFSRQAFHKQLLVPGLVAFRAVHRGTTVGMLLWYLQGKVGYYHLGAYNTKGYRLHASFALFWCSIEYFASLDDLHWLNLGTGAGIKCSGTDGLARFKRGWSTGTRMAYFCGRILNRPKYAEIAQAYRVGPTDYFPAYRKGEFG